MQNLRLLYGLMSDFSETIYCLLQFYPVSKSLEWEGGRREISVDFGAVVGAC